MFTKPPNGATPTTPSSGTTTSLSTVTPPAPMADTGPRRSQPKAPSLIAEDITVEGAIIGDAELHVDGVVKGDVKVSRLSLGETGHIDGSVTSETMECRGRVTGSISAKQVRLYSTAHVEGDITHDQLSMETGAFFQGRAMKYPPQARAQAPQPLIGEVVKVNAREEHAA